MQKWNFKVGKQWLFVIFMLVGANNTFAQDTKNPDKWQVYLQPYALFPNMNGSLGVGDLPNVSVDANPGDIFKNLKMGAMLYSEVYKGSWVISSDFIYMRLGADAETKNGILGGSVDVKQVGWEVAGLYHIKQWLGVGVAVQLNSINSDVSLDLSLPVELAISKTKSLEQSETWVDPSILVRVKMPLSRKLHVHFRGNVGGFGIGSNFYWQTQAHLGYRFSRVFDLSLGYRAISMDYENEKGNDRFVYDITTFGPEVRFGFTLF